MTTATGNLTETVVKKIRELPPLPLVVQKLLIVMRDENCSADDITRVLSSDQALASMVLKLVNSSFFGMSGQVGTISRAVVILGHVSIRNLALGLGAARILTEAGFPERQRILWAHAIGTAAAAEVLARNSDYPDPEEAFIAGLLHDVGRILLTIAVPEAYEDVVASRPADLSASEMTALGIDHTRAGRRLLRHWKLPDHLIESVRRHHDPKATLAGGKSLVTYVALGDALSCLWGKECEQPDPALDFAELAKKVGYDLPRITTLLPEIEERIALTRAFLAAIKLDDDQVTAAPTAIHAQVVVVGTDPARYRWATGVLTHFGATVVPMKDYFADAKASRQADVVILDAASIRPEQWARIAPLLSAAGTRCFAFADGLQQAQSACGGLDIAPLQFVFTAADLLPALS